MTTPNKKDKEALGKGIRSLLQNIDADLKTAAGSLRPAIAENITGILRIPLDLFETNPKQHKLKIRESTKIPSLSCHLTRKNTNLPAEFRKIPLRLNLHPHVSYNFRH